MSVQFKIIPANSIENAGLYQFSTETRMGKQEETRVPISFLEDDEYVVGSFRHEPRQDTPFVCLMNNGKLVRLHPDFDRRRVEVSNRGEKLELPPYTIQFRNDSAAPRLIEKLQRSEISHHMLWCEEMESGGERMLAVAYETRAASTALQHFNLLVFPLKAEGGIAPLTAHYHIEILNLPDERGTQSIISKYQPGRDKPSYKVWQMAFEETDLRFRTAHPHVLLLDDVHVDSNGRFMMLDPAKGTFVGEDPFISNPVEDDTLEFPVERCFSQGNIFVLRGDLTDENDETTTGKTRILQIDPSTMKVNIYYLSEEDQTLLHGWDEVIHISDIIRKDYVYVCTITGLVAGSNPGFSKKIRRKFELLETYLDSLQAPSGERGRGRDVTSLTRRLLRWSLPVIGFLAAIAYFFRGRLQKLWAAK